MTPTSITDEDVSDTTNNELNPVQSVEEESTQSQVCQLLNDVTPVMNNAPSTDHSETCSEATTDVSDSEISSEKQRSLRTRQKRKRPDGLLVTWEKKVPRKKENGDSKIKPDEIVLFENPDDLLPPSCLKKVDMANEIVRPVIREPVIVRSENSCTSENRVDGEENVVEEASEPEVPVEDESLIEMRNLISKWYDEKSQKSAEEIQEEVDLYLENELTQQLRPLMKKASLSAKAEERFHEHVFEKAKLRKRRHSVEESEENDLYIPSQPKLYKREFVVEEIKEMEIDR